MAKRTKTEQNTDRARAALSPCLNAAAVVAEFGKTFGEQDINTLTEQLVQSTQRVNQNNLTRCENLLFAQAHALQSIFVNLSRRASNQTQLRQFETHMRLAFKAQAQCVRTLEVLATLKNPPVVIAQQANVTTGPQQVNNGIAFAHGNTENAPNQRLERNDGERLDPGTTGTTSGTDPAMATVEAIQRA